MLIMLVHGFVCIVGSALFLVTDPISRVFVFLLGFAVDWIFTLAAIMIPVSLAIVYFDLKLACPIAIACIVFVVVTAVLRAICDLLARPVQP